MLSDEIAPDSILQVSLLKSLWKRSPDGKARGGVGVVLPYMGYISMCGPKGYGFSAVLVIDRVSILANFGHFGHKWGMVFAL